MLFETRESGDTLVLEVQVGRLDASVATEFKAEAVRLVEAGRTRLLIDLSRVNFVDSSGLGALVGVMKAVDRAGPEGQLELAGLTRPVRRVLDLTRLSDVFRIRSSATVR